MHEGVSVWRFRVFSTYNRFPLIVGINIASRTGGFTWIGSNLSQPRYIHLEKKNEYIYVYIYDFINSNVDYTYI